MSPVEGRRGLRLLAHAAGLLLTIAALAFVGWKGWEQRATMAELAPGSEAWLPLPVATLVYAGCLLLLVRCWQLLLRFSGARATGFRLAFLLQARSQIAKYLPGNVLHLAGRHLVGRRAGLAHSQLFSAALYETLGLLAAAAIVVLAGWSRLNAGEGFGGAWLPLAVLLAGLAGLAVLPSLQRRLAGLGAAEPPPARSGKDIARALLPVQAIYVAFFVGSGLIASALAHRLDPSVGPALPLVACTLAWMLGFVTPGAPAGLGVREAVQLGLLAPVFGEPAALLLSLQLRMATLGGDLLLFLSSLPWGAVEREPGT